MTLHLPQRPQPGYSVSENQRSETEWLMVPKSETSAVSLWDTFR